ncbi:tyrosine-type recombinase/integrase [uncultured Roseibium sp.]|uniref:DUF6538 domain-containing protein n=1 Tax=uncultured Roseibium sp. TaxID=1936171 RepID=UPI0025964415|nr:tyrosine-type recombinase/integrase [uncultured Roseibium sp.]
MRLPKYVFKRNNTLYAYMDIPKRHQEVLGSRRFVKSLKTDSPARAARLVVPVVVAWKSRIAKLDETDVVAQEAALWRESLAALPEGSIEREGLELAMTSELEKAAEINEGAAVRKASLVFAREGELVEHHVSSYMSTLDVTKTTENSYNNNLQRLIAVSPRINFWTRKACVEHVHGLCEVMPHSSVQRMTNPYRGLWQYLYDRELVSENPWIGIKLPKKDIHKKAPQRPYTDEEAKEVLAGCPTNIRRLMGFLACSGMRLSEALALTPEDVSKEGDWYWYRVREGKTENAARTVPVKRKFKLPLTDQPEQARERIRSYIRKKITKDSTISPTHSFRHRVATVATSKGHPEAEIAYFLGHANRGITRSRYGRTAINEEALQAIATSVYLPTP